MAQSQVALYNLALSIVGANSTVVATTDQTIETEMCNLWYENVRQVTLRAAHWNSSRRAARLVEEAERDPDVDWALGAPEPGWAWSYDWPANMLAARYMTNFAEFAVGYDNDGKVILSNVGGDALTDAPVLVYTIDNTDASLWEPDLYQAIAYALAGHICMPLSGKLSRVKATLEIANGIILAARANNANEYYRMMQQIPASLSARGYSYGPAAPFIFPYGSTFTSTGAPLA